MSVVGDISEFGQSTTGCSEECCFGVMYCEWYGVCDFVVLSVVDYGGVNVFHGVGVCVNVCGVVVCSFQPSSSLSQVLRV